MRGPATPAGPPAGPLWGAGMEQASKARQAVIAALAVGLSAFHLYTGVFGVFETMMQRSVHLLGLLTLLFLTTRTSPRLSARTNARLDLPLAGLAFAIGLYNFVHHDRIVSREWYYGPITSWDILLGVLLVLLVLEGARRACGPAIAIIAGLFLVYPLLGHYFPSPLTIRRTGFVTLIDHLFLTPQAIFGFPIGVSATFVYLFVLFGAFLEVTGGGKFFIDLAMALVGRFTGGPAKVAIVSSAFFGTISGSAVANVYGTGIFTIPMMTRYGYRKEFAAAVECTSSTGGQITPPVLGAAAFVMAEFLGVSYATIMVAAIIPALLYYLSIYTGVHSEAVKQGLRGLPKEEIPAAWEVLKRGFHFLLPIATLVYLLLAGYTAFRAVFMAIVVLLGVVMLRRETRIGPRELWRAMALGAHNAIPVAAACAAAGIVVGVLDITGLGIKFVSLILFLSGGILPFALILLMAAVIVLGMGMPTTPAYILAALVGAPVLIEMGADKLAAHMFVFGGAILSSITPPVALAAYAAAAIAGANPMRVGWIACRLGFPKFLVPFLYVYNPVLLMQGPPLLILQAVVTAALGVFAFSFAADGWLWRALRPMHRLAFGAAGILLIVPELYTDLAGLGLFGAAFVPAWRARPAPRGASVEVAVGGADGGH